MMDTVLFSLGLAAGLATHELGHQSAAWLLGDQLAWHGTNWSCVGACAAQAIALGGFVLPAVSSEVLLYKDDRGPLAAGWLAWNILHPLIYTIRNEAFGPVGDLANFSRGEAQIVEAALLTYAASVALRWAWKDKPEWFQVTPTDRGVTAMLRVRW